MKKVFNQLNLVGLDTNIFIYYFEGNPDFGEKTKKVFNYMANNDLAAVTSIIALIEILSAKFLSKKTASEMENKFINIPNLAISEVNRSISIEAARIRREYGFRTPDAIQLATALSAKTKAFITNDKLLKPFKELKVLLLDDIN